MLAQHSFLCLLFRWFNILASVVVVGGMAFARFVVLASQSVLPVERREALHTAMRARLSNIVAAAIGFLLISGLYSIAVIEAKTTASATYWWYRPLFMLKFGLALVIFALASLLSGKTAAAQKLRQDTARWLSQTLVLAVAVVCISDVLWSAENTPKPPKASATSQASAPNAAAER